MPEQVNREIELPAPVDEVWRAITERSGLENWLADEVDMELHPGGDATFREDGLTRSGWVEEVVSPASAAEARLTFWWSVGQEPASRVELTLTPLADGRTRLRVVESRPLEQLGRPHNLLPRTMGRRDGPVVLAGTGTW